MEIGGPQYIKNKMAQIQALIEQSESDVDEDGELVDNLFAVQNFGIRKEDDLKAQEMLKRFQQSEKEMADIEKDLPEEEKF